MSSFFKRSGRPVGERQQSVSLSLLPLREMEVVPQILGAVLLCLISKFTIQSISMRH